MKRDLNVKTTSETPVKDDLGDCYEKGAVQADKTPLSKDENWSTADYNLKKQKKEAHAEALEKESEHYEHNHPHEKLDNIVEKAEPQILEEPSSIIDNRNVVRFGMTEILSRRRRRRKAK